ncbi:peptidase M23 [archaeon]|nr:peptidase M23 [archaeon]
MDIWVQIPVSAFNKVEQLLKELKFGNILNFNLNKEKILILNFNKNNKELNKVNIYNTEELTKYLFNKLKQTKAKVAIGKYNEDRSIYKNNNEFKNRTIHLGIDLLLKENTKIFAPLKGKVHSFKNNKGIGNYGPTIILEHNLNNIKFYTLYGHLSLTSLKNIKPNQIIQQEQPLATVGTTKVNGNWPPHLHFQIIKDLKNNKGDFPGVSSKKERNKYLNLCPNPNLILKIKKLN